MAIINVDDAYILNETGAQVDKTTGIPFKNENLSDAEAAQARANIRAGGTNPNLLDNPFFQVNQRSFTTEDFGSSGNGYTVDRWKGYRSIVTVKSDKTIDFTPNSGAYGIAQFIEAGRLVVGNTYTASVNIGGTIYSWTFVYSTTAAYSPYFGTSNRFYHHTSSNNSVDLWITGTANVTYNVRSFKLELGSVSTLANDTPPDYGTELLKCLRYAWLVKTQQYECPWIGFAINTATVVFDIVPPVPMRAGSATFAVTGTFYISQNGSAPVSCTIGTITALENGNLSCAISGTFTSTTLAAIYTSNNAPTILISRDL